MEPAWTRLWPLLTQCRPLALTQLLRATGDEGPWRGVAMHLVTGFKHNGLRVPATRQEEGPHPAPCVWACLHIEHGGKGARATQGQKASRWVDAKAATGPSSARDWIRLTACAGQGERCEGGRSKGAPAYRVNGNHRAQTHAVAHVVTRRRSLKRHHTLWGRRSRLDDHAPTRQVASFIPGYGQPDTFYPDYFEGTWQLTRECVGVTVPEVRIKPPTNLVSQTMSYKR